LPKTVAVKFPTSGETVADAGDENRQQD
jgi:hypothetical protein